MIPQLHIWLHKLIQSLIVFIKLCDLINKCCVSLYSLSEFQKQIATCIYPNSDCLRDKRIFIYHQFKFLALNFQVWKFQPQLHNKPQNRFNRCLSYYTLSTQPLFLSLKPLSAPTSKEKQPIETKRSKVL